MTVETVKQAIKKKFGTYSAFAKAAGIDRYELERDFLSQDKVDRLFLAGMAKMVRDTKPSVVGRPLTASKIKALKRAINALGGVDTFCAENGFSRNTVFQVVSGRYERITRNVKKLMDHLKIEA